MANEQLERKAEERGVEFVPFAAADKIRLTVKMVQEQICVPTKSGKVCSWKDALKFTMLCQSQRLNPWSGDAYLVGYDSQDGPSFSLITSHAAFLKRAEACADYEGMDSGIILLVDEETGEVKEREGDFHLAAEKVVGGWARVFRKGRRPTYRRLRMDRFNKGFAEWRKDPAGMIVKCFDEETEVLTSFGFEKFASAEGKVLQVTDRGLETTDSVPFFKAYTGPMVEYRSRNGNFRVTPNHDMPIALNGSPEAKIEASALLNLRQRDTATMPLTLAHSRPEHSIDDNTIRLAAAYIADGWDNSASTGFAIAVSRKHKIQRLTELAMHRSSNVKHDAGRKAELSSGRVITTKADKTVFYYSRTAAFTSLVARQKQINHDTILMLSMRQARLLLDTWIAYDGHCQAKMRCGRLYTSRTHHIRAIELLAVVAGYSVNKSTSRAGEGGKNRHDITITNRTSVNLESSKLVSVPNAGKGVWCVTVPTHKIVVRRNGFSAVCFQCSEADALRSTFPSLLGGLYTDNESVIVDIQSTRVAATPAAQSGLVEVVKATTIDDPVQQREPEQTKPEPDKDPTTPLPPTPPNGKDSPSTELGRVVVEAGYNFDVFAKWGAESGNVPKVDSMADFSEVPEKVAERLLVGKRAMLKALGIMKETLI